MTTYTQDQIGTLKSAISVATIELRAAWDLLATPSTSQPLTLDQIHEALLSFCDDGSAPTSTDDPEFLELIVPLARAIEAKIKGGA